MQRKRKSFKDTFEELQYIGLLELVNAFTAKFKKETIDISELIEIADNSVPILEKYNSIVFISNIQAVNKTKYVSPNCKAVTGYETYEFIKGDSKFFHEIYCQAEKKSALEYLKIIIEHQKQASPETKKDYIYSTTFRMFHKYGYFKWMQSFWFFYLFKQNNPVISISILSDIDDIKADDCSTLNIYKFDKEKNTYKTERKEKSPPYGFDILTKEEIRILKLLSDGLNNRETAKALNTTEHIIKDRRKKMLKKTWCSNITELIYHAYRNNLIKL
jgi:DNA-binding CsgD family transcriptional regulator